MMEIIHADEVTHVTTGHRWFTWVCQQQQQQLGEVVDPVEAFREEVKRGWNGAVKGPFNVEDREKAGLSREFYEDLKGEMNIPTSSGEKGTDVNGKGLEDVKELRDAITAVPVQYETERL